LDPESNGDLSGLGRAFLARTLYLALDGEGLKSRKEIIDDMAKSIEEEGLDPVAVIMSMILEVICDCRDLLEKIEKK